MLQTQHETGRQLYIGVVNRFNDAVRRIKRYIDAGELGDVYHVYISFRSCRAIPGLGGAFTTKEIAGGGALIKGLDRRLNEKTGIPFHIAEDPLRAIARGTGIALKNINRFSFLMK